MKDEFSRALWDLKTSINKVFLLETFLEACLLFLIAYLLVSLAGFLNHGTTIIILVSSMCFFILKSFMNTLIDKVDLTGVYYRDLYEELLTARDHPSENNQVITDLHKEAVKHMSKIEEAVFFNTKSVAVKVFAVIVICGLIIITAPINLQEVPAIKTAVQEITKQRITLSLGSPETQLSGGPSGMGDIKQTGELYGQKKQAVSGVTATKFEVPTSNFEVNIKEEDITGVDNQNFQSVFPTDIGTPDPSLYGENIPKEQQELVKNYFRISAEG